jgi:hypothetical protein
VNPLSRWWLWLRYGCTLDTRVAPVEPPPRWRDAGAGIQIQAYHRAIFVRSPRQNHVLTLPEARRLAFAVLDEVDAAERLTRAVVNVGVVYGRGVRTQQGGEP